MEGRWTVDGRCPKDARPNWHLNRLQIRLDIVPFGHPQNPRLRLHPRHWRPGAPVHVSAFSFFQLRGKELDGSMDSKAE